MNLTNKFTLAILSIIFIVVSVFTYKQVSQQTMTLEKALHAKVALIEEGLEEKAAYTISHIKQEVENDLASYNLAHLNQLLKNLSEEKDVLLVALVSQHNRTTVIKGDMKLYDSLTGHSVESTTITKNQKKPFFEIATPIYLSQKWGELRIVYSLKRLEQELADTKREIDTQTQSILKDAIATAFLLGIIILLLGYYFVKKLTKPILLLTENAKKIADGNFEISRELKHLNSKDEVGILANTFEQMNDNLLLTYKKLENSNNSLNAFNLSLKEKVREALHKEREKAKLLMQQSRLASMGEMIEQIAHQWRQPLNTLALINNDLYFKIKLHTFSEDEFEKAHDQINESLQYMSQTINDFRTYLKNNQEKEDICVSELLGTAFALNDAIMKFTKITCVLESDSDIYIRTTKSELLQVFMSLLKNAHDIIVERKVQKGRIYAKITHTQKWVRISIQDNAGGIEEQYLANIFEPYFTTRAETEGTGIGLYMSKTIVEERLHGKLEVENTAEGACFTISLPLRER